MEEYSQRMKCLNCGIEFVEKFKKGETCQGYFDCPNCGRNEVRSCGVPSNG